MGAIQGMSQETTESALTPFDHHLLAQGAHLDLHRKLGAHESEEQGVRGVRFSVWAPSARAVSVVGDFNAWDGARHAMRSHGSGVWETFIAGVGPGALYK